MNRSFGWGRDSRSGGCDLKISQGWDKSKVTSTSSFLTSDFPGWCVDFMKVDLLSSRTSSSSSSSSSLLPTDWLSLPSLPKDISIWREVGCCCRLRQKAPGARRLPQEEIMKNLRKAKKAEMKGKTKRETEKRYRDATHTEREREREKGKNGKSTKMQSWILRIFNPARGGSIPASQLLSTESLRNCGFCRSSEKTSLFQPGKTYVPCAVGWVSYSQIVSTISAVH